MKKFLSFILLAVCSSPSFSLDVSRYSKDFAALGLSGAELSVTVPAVPLRGYPGPDPEALRAEAMADPDKFIDEHTPDEVGLAFGLRPPRFMITDKARIENAALRITVDLSRQRLVVRSSDTANEFKISTGILPAHPTPGSGKCYAPDFLEAMHYSSLYNSAPMPNSVFFNGNIAMHGTGAEALLGQPASHGCVRMSKADSRTVYDLVKAAGKAGTIICVQGVTPPKAP